MKTLTDVKTFIKTSGADSIIYEIRSELMKDGAMPVYSDICKEENGKVYQYVNYVQEGGGVLGVALAGYTYVLEKLGFRFLKLAGTSAGAINTIMIASIDKENYPEFKNEKIETKSEIILYELLNKNLWDLVDGSKFGKWLINLAVNNKTRLTFIVNLFKITLIIPFLYTLFSFIKWKWKILLNETLNTIINYAAYISISLFVVFLIITVYYIYRFDKAHFGINPGNNFYDWIKGILERNQIKNTEDLNQVMKNRFEGLTLRKDPDRNESENNTNISAPYLTIITSDVTNQLKVEFPQMAEEYYTKERLSSISPACFVRASMSIPVFFAPMRITVDESVINTGFVQKKGLVAAQFSKIKEKENIRSYEVHFVDGGILSNFPISVFHNPAIKIARMPTFGAKLEDSKKLNGEEIEHKRLMFFPFLYKIFNTVRFNYDKDFLKKNGVYEQCIGHIDVADYNWLNFGMDDETKIELFRKGAEAAKTFLLGGDVWIKGRQNKISAFSWKKFKKERAEV